MLGQQNSPQLEDTLIIVIYLVLQRIISYSSCQTATAVCATSSSGYASECHKINTDLSDQMVEQDKTLRTNETKSTVGPTNKRQLQSSAANKKQFQPNSRKDE